MLRTDLEFYHHEESAFNGSWHEWTWEQKQTCKLPKANKSSIFEECSHPGTIKWHFIQMISASIQKSECFSVTNPSIDCTSSRSSIVCSFQTSPPSRQGSFVKILANFEGFSRRCYRYRKPTWVMDLVLLCEWGRRFCRKSNHRWNSSR